MNSIQRISLVLTIIGAINWGLIGSFQYDLIDNIFGGRNPELTGLIYGLIGAAGLINLGILLKPIGEHVKDQEVKYNK